MREAKLKFISNLIYAFGAQTISLILSILMSLFVPKILGVSDYSFWQLFIFYIGYVGFSHLGLIDGIYLKLGGKKYNDLDYSLLGSEFWITLIFQSIIGLVLIIFAKISIQSNDRLFVIRAALCYMLLHNATAYIGYIFQAVNKTKIYSISIIIERLLFIVVVILALIDRTKKFKYFIIMYIFAKAVSLIYCVIQGRKIIFAKLKFNRVIIREMLNSISIGSKLLIANIASMFIIGIGRVFIDNIWGINEFGKISFSISLTNFMLQFVGQLSIVLFPTLRQMDESKQKYIYINLINLIGLCIPIIFLIYIPAKNIIAIWLPDYEVSLQYMTFLLPIVAFDGKMQLVCNTYFKVYRKEKWLLKINIVSAILSIILCYFSAYIAGNLELVIISMVISIAFRSIISEIYLARVMNTNIKKIVLLDILMILTFVILSFILNSVKLFIVYMLIYIIYMYLHKDTIKKYYFRLKLTKS